MSIILIYHQTRISDYREQGLRVPGTYPITQNKR
nr:MAG TPA: hypothetical protein [Caudoviricetes sp.]